jgi:hypothetical protein
MDDDQSQDIATPPEEAQTHEVPISDVSSQSDGSTPTDLPTEAPESPKSVSINTSVEDQNQGVNQPKSEVPDEPISAPNEPETPVEDQPTPVNNNPPASEEVQPVPNQSEPQSAPSAPTPLTSPVPQAQSSAQQYQAGFIHALLIKAQAKIQSNKQKKLDKIILFAQKNKIFANEDVQKLLHISSAITTRYLVKLVE